MNTSPMTITVGDPVVIALGCGEGVAQEGVFDGISRVTIDGIELMDSSFPSSFAFKGPDGIEYRRFHFVGTVIEGECTVVKALATGCYGDHSWQRDQYGDGLAYLGRPRRPPTLAVDFVFAPVRETFRARRFDGFNLSFRLSSPGARLGVAQWLQHWEIGGRATGNHLLHQSQISSPAHDLSRDSEWDNLCWKALEDGRGEENVSMQLNVRCAYHQLFDVLWHDDGVLLGYFPTASAVHTASRKNRGEDNWFVLDVSEFPLSGEAVVPGKTLLFSASPADARRDETEAKNLWFSVNRFLEDSYRAQTGIRQSRLLPTKLHGMWETVAVDGQLCFGSQDSHVHAERYLESVAQELLPALHAQGYRRFWTRPFCVSDTTELLFWNKAMRGRGVMDGDVAFGSCCCVWKYAPSDVFGGVAAARRFYEAGHRAGMEIGIWVGNHLSTRAPILREHPEWVLKDCRRDNPTGGYDSHVLAVIDWNSGVREWILADLLAWKRDCGLDFIFLDSLGNLGLKTRNHADPLLRNNFAGLCTFLAELTAHGIEVICEGRSFVGAPFFAISATGNMASKSDPLVGQNSLSWFQGHEDMLSGMHVFTEPMPAADTSRLLDLHFRIVANHAILSVRNGSPLEVFGFYRIFNLVSAWMIDRELLPDDCGVRWRADDGKELLFSYRKGRFPLPHGSAVATVRPEGIGPFMETETLDTEPNSVYLIVRHVGINAMTCQS